MLIRNVDIRVISLKKKTRLLHSKIIQSRGQNASFVIGYNILVKNLIKMIFYF